MYNSKCALSAIYSMGDRGKAMSRRRGDRKDARLVREIDAFHTFMVHLMPKRTDAEVYMHTEIDITKLSEFLKGRNEETDRYKTTLFHAVVTAVAKTIKMRPKLNYYISGRRFFERDDITMSFVAKKQFTDRKSIV